MSPSKQCWVPVNQASAATSATVALKNLGCPNLIGELLLQEDLILNQKIAQRKRVQLHLTFEEPRTNVLC